jgi:hypothetical protein
MQWSDEQFSPYKQLLLVIIILILIFLYYNKAFKNEDYNKLCLIYAIFIASWLGTIILRYLILHYYPMPPNHNVIFYVPYEVKCYFRQKDCDNGDFTIFSVIHIVSYIIIGYFVPGYYLEILVISILCEFLEYGMGFSSKFLLDPAINLIGYFIGTQISYSLSE